MRPHHKLGFLLAGALFFGPLAARSCQVPVFRFALERWSSDVYRVVVVHRGDLAAGQEEAFAILKNSRNSNIRFESYDLDHLTESQQWLVPADEVKKGEAKVFVYYPEFAGAEDPFWAADLNPRSATEILSSPVRARLEERIIAGDSTVWLLLESGNKALDDAAEGKLKQLVGIAGETLKIPEGVIGQKDIASGKVDPNRDPIDMDNILRSKVPLKISFSTMRLGPGEIGESFFTRMLTGAQGGGEQLRDQPMVVAVFGRGRMMPAIPASDLNETNFLQAAEYLCGACSCQIKEENPGLDLLMQVDWDKHLEGNLVYVERSLPPLVGTPAVQRLPAEKKEAGDDEQDGESGTMSVITRNLLFAGGILVAAVLGASFVFSRPRPL